MSIFHRTNSTSVPLHRAAGSNNGVEEGAATRSVSSAATQLRDQLFALTNELKSPSLERQFAKKVDILESMTQLMVDASRKKTVESVIRTINHQKNRLLFGEQSGKAWSHSSTMPVARDFVGTEIHTPNTTGDQQQSGSFYLLRRTQQHKRSVFASDHKRAFDAIVAEIKPRRNLAHLEKFRVDGLSGLKEPKDKALMNACASEVSRRCGLAPVWNALFGTVDSLKPERQHALVDTFHETFAHVSAQDRHVLVEHMGDAFATLLAKHASLSPSLQDYLPRFLNDKFALMTTSQKASLRQALSASGQQGNPSYGFLNDGQRQFAL
ncbi:MAG: hypothetical protein ACRYGK_01445 [Janthinobacterium lividum]